MWESFDQKTKEILEISTASGPAMSARYLETVLKSASLSGERRVSFLGLAS